MTTLSSFEDNVLSRDISALHVFSDTQNARGARDARDPRFADFDAAVTTDFRSLRLLEQDTRDSIARNPLLGAYGAETIVKLQDHAAELVEKITKHGRITPNIERTRDAIHNRTRQIVVNNALRNKRNRTNGHDFFLGITYNGIELYVTPEELAQFNRRDIVSLFHIPNRGHPLFDGKREQFRSSVISLSRNFPDHLIRVYGYETREELIDAIEQGTETTIPEQQHPLQTAFADRYGNVRARSQRIETLRDSIESQRNHDGLIGLRVNGAQQGPIPAHVVSCLDEIPGGEVGVYENVSDGEQDVKASGYLEIVRKFPDGQGEEGIESDAYETLGRKIGVPIEIVKI